MDKRFLKAFLTPRATSLLGYTLYPWCLKHRLQLTALESPLLTGQTVTAADVLLFARVCSESRLAKPPSLIEQWRLARLAARPDLRDEALEAIGDHIGADRWPKFWDPPSTEGGERRNNGMPWALAVVTILVRNGVSLEEALHLPESQAIWLSAAFGIQAGGKLEFLTSDDEALLDSLSTVERPPNEPKPTV